MFTITAWAEPKSAGCLKQQKSSGVKKYTLTRYHPGNKKPYASQIAIASKDLFLYQQRQGTKNEFM
jgi:hypothetical protein